MDLGSVILNEVSQIEEEKYGIPCMRNLKKKKLGTHEPTKQKETHTLRKQTYGCQGEGIVRECGKVMYTLLYSKWVTRTTVQHMEFYST